MWGLGGLVLLTLLTADDLRVSQEPERAQVAPGAEVTLGCRVVAAAPWELLRLEWHKEGGREALCDARLRPAAAAAETPCAPRLRLAWHPPRATLRLRGARPGDAGRYVCRATLEIPRLAAASGNGTLLGVGAAADDGGGAGLPGGLAGGLAGGLGGSALLLLLLLLGLALGCCWRRCRKADMVTYANALPRSARAPKELVPLVEMQSSTYQGGLQRARPPRPPACPRPPGAPDACCAKP